MTECMVSSQSRKRAFICCSLLLLAGLLSTAASVSGQDDNGVVIDAEAISAAANAPGSVVAALSLNGNGEAAAAPHLVELYTADWCAPCRDAETNVAALSEWWPDIATVAHHPSNLSSERYHLPQSRQMADDYGVDGYPTIIVDGHWLLRGAGQMNELQDVVSTLSSYSADLAGEGATLIGASAGGFSETSTTITWNVSLPDGINAEDVRMDVMVVAPTSVEGGATIQSVVSMQTGLQVAANTTDTETLIVWDVEEIVGASYVLILRMNGEPAPEVASDTPIGLLRNSPVVVEASWLEDNPHIIWMVGILSILLLSPALARSIVKMPTLLGRGSLQEEE
jgi:thiol-disulfide isomerase/thioredoxin